MEFSYEDLSIDPSTLTRKKKYNDYVEKEYFDNFKKNTLINEISYEYIGFNYKNNNEYFGIYKSPTKDNLYYCYQQIQSIYKYNFWLSFAKQPVITGNERIDKALPFLKNFKTGCYSFSEVLRLNYKPLHDYDNYKLYVVFAVSANEEYIKKGKIYPIDIEMCYTLSISTQSRLPMSAHMGIFRSCYYYKEPTFDFEKLIVYTNYIRLSDSFQINKDKIVNLKDKIIHSGISVEIHKFGFFITKILHPSIIFMKFTPIENAKKLLKDKLIFKEKNEVVFNYKEDKYDYKNEKFDIKWLHFHDNEKSIEIEIDKNIVDFNPTIVVDGSKRRSKRKSKRKSKKRSSKRKSKKRSSKRKSKRRSN
jgi:hypothetical protein